LGVDDIVISRRRSASLLILATVLVLTAAAGAAESVSFPFFGVKHTDRTETAPRPLRIHVMTIDLSNPAIGFLVTPQIGPRDTLIQTTRQFLSVSSAQLAINAHFFTPFPDDGTGTTSLIGLAASSVTSGPQGHAYAPFERNLGGAFQIDLPALNIDANNVATLVYQAAGDATGYATDPPVVPHNAVSGNEQLVSNGLNVAGTTAFDTTLNPRSAIGIAPGGKLILLTVDGRQPGVSEGMTTSELADLLRFDYGVIDAVNLDGGGSTTLAIADPAPRLVNVPVGVNNIPNTERLVGSSLAVFASSCSMATEGAACGDVDPCNGVETCVAGICQRSPVSCSVAVSAEGSRHLAVIPPPGLASVALKVSSADLPCFPRYVDAAGRLSASPVFQSSEQWDTVHVGDRSIVPATSYAVTAELPGGGEAGYGFATTGGWGDANGGGGVSVFDILCVIDGSEGLFTHCSRNADDQNTGVPDGAIEIGDILATLEAFSGSPYTDTDPCEAPQTISRRALPLH
jgi:hypothetical protein